MLPGADRFDAPETVTLIVDLSHDESSWTFALAPGSSRAIVVGSRADADVRLRNPLVAPMHFHLEREGDSVLLVPDYGRDVQLNGVPVRGPAALEDVTIEFSGLSMRAQVRCASASGKSRSHFASFSEDAVTVSIATADAATNALEVLDVDSVEAPTTAVDRASIEAGTGALSESLDDARTEVMEVMRFDTAPISESTIPSSALASDQPSSQGDAVQTTPAVVGPVPGSVASSATEAITMAVPPAPPDWDTLAPRAELSEHADSPVKEEASNVSVDPSSSQETLDPPGDPRPSPALRWLEELGQLAKRRPLAIGCAALATALVGTFALIGVKSAIDARLPNPQSTAVGDADAVSDEASESKTGRPVAEEPLARSPEAPPESEGTAHAVVEDAADPVAEEEPGSPATKSGETVPERNEARTSEARAAVAVSHLLSGRYEDARREYARLAEEHPDVEAFQAAARLLAKRLASPCANGAPSTACPKVQR